MARSLTSWSMSAAFSRFSVHSYSCGTYGWNLNDTSLSANTSQNKILQSSVSHECNDPQKLIRLTHEISSVSSGPFCGLYSSANVLRWRYWAVTPLSSSKIWWCVFKTYPLSVFAQLFTLTQMFNCTNSCSLQSWLPLFRTDKFTPDWQIYSEIQIRCTMLFFGCLFECKWS